MLFAALTALALLGTPIAEANPFSRASDDLTTTSTSRSVQSGSRKLKEETTITIGVSKSCKASSKARVTSRAFNVHTSAMAEAAALTCEDNQFESGQAYLFALAEAFAKDTIAIAEAIASTSVECTSSGSGSSYSFACAKAEAEVDKAVTFLANAHSRAIAGVESRCKHCSANAKLRTNLRASIYADIVAGITSYSYSQVCVSGDEHKKQFETCLSSMIAEQFAYAFAEAFLDTDCHGELDASIAAEASAYVQIKSSSKCLSKPPKYY